MDTEIIQDLPSKRRKTPGLSPSDWRHDLLRAKLDSSRDINVRSLCRSLKISHRFFYQIINGRANAYRNKVAKVALALGFSEDEIIPEKTLA